MRTRSRTKFVRNWNEHAHETKRSIDPL